MCPARSDGPGDADLLPLITIVTPVFNAVETLAETLASIAAQRYPRLEHVVVDAVSTDGTLELLRAEERAGRIKLISEPDRGLSDAFNKGVAAATGDLIGWLNADDVYEPGALFAVGAAFVANPDAEWLVGRCKIIGGDGAETRRAVTAYKNFLLKRFSLGLYLTNNFVSSPATFVRRDVIAETGALDERFKYSADYDLWLRLARRGKPAYVDADVARFRMAEGSLSITGFEQQFREHALNARENGNGHRLAVAVNQLMSRAIVLVYRSIKRRRRRRGGSASSG
ncbi:MAG: glycosyltransferase [Thermoleophilia bacterium]|nr:glycosyltransferase [Thermoleophilia bacterium]